MRCLGRHIGSGSHRAVGGWVRCLASHLLGRELGVTGIIPFGRGRPSVPIRADLSTCKLPQGKQRVSGLAVRGLCIPFSVP